MQHAPGITIRMLAWIGLGERNRAPGVYTLSADFPPPGATVSDDDVRAGLENGIVSFDTLAENKPNPATGPFPP